jgi:tetratricopeptide (TPR) repeat protein
LADDTRIDEILGDWVARREAGEEVTPDDVLAAHPDLAGELRGRFAALDLVDRALGVVPRMAIPDRIGDYAIECELGYGGMGSVYRARGEDGSSVALKVVHPHLLQRRGFFKRFLREASLGMRVDHPNVVRTLDVDALSDGVFQHHFLVMEYLEGQTLRDLLAELERLPEDLCRHIGREISQALCAIHDAGAVHRDLKPENVLITPDHVVKVMDLGVAKLQDEAVRLSQTGAFVGSVPYAAPEQFGAGGVAPDHRVDLHALGVLLYELAAGKHPYGDDDPRFVMRRILEEEPRRLGELNPQVSTFLEELVHVLLAKDPDQRPTSAADVLGILSSGEESEWWREQARLVRARTKRPLRRIRIPRETAVYGREDDLGRLRDWYERAKAGEGAVVLVEGEAGIGKSRLVDELLLRLHREGEDLNFLFASYPPGGAATASGAFSAAYCEHFGSEGLESALVEHLPQTPLLVPAFASLLRGDVAPRDAEPLTKDSLQTCFVHTTRSLAAVRTTVVLIEDLHFAPNEGRALFASLALAVPGHRIMLIGTSRPGLPESWRANLERLDHTRALELHRLGPKDLSDLLRDAFQSERLAEELGWRIAKKSDGNPFFVFEIIRGLREGQLIAQRADGSWYTTRVIDDIAVPSSVLDLVNARVSSLSEEERDVLDVAACCGYEFDPSLVSEATGIAKIPLCKLLAQIERAHRLVRAAGRRFVFDHHQVQEALYDALPDLLREEYHASLGEALEAASEARSVDPATLDGALCFRIADHGLRGARLELAGRYLHCAIEYLFASHLTADCAALIERALEAPGLLAGEARARMLLSYTDALEPLGKPEQQKDVALEAVRIAVEAGDERLHARCRRAYGHALECAFENEAAETELEAAIAMARGLDDREIEIAGLSCLGAVAGHLGDRPRSRGIYEQLVAMTGEFYAEDPERANRMVGNLGIALYQEGRLDEALAQLERFQAFAQDHGVRKSQAIAALWLGHTTRLQGRLQVAQRHYERALELARQMGKRSGEVWAISGLGVVTELEGDPEKATEYYRRHLDLSREIGSRWGEQAALGNLGLGLFALGRLHEALALHEQHLTMARDAGARHETASALHNIGLALEELGDDRAAQARYEEGLAMTVANGDLNLEAELRLACGSLAAKGGDAETSRELLERARDLSEEHGYAGIEVLARCELALQIETGVERALGSYERHEDRLSWDQRRSALYLLWSATRDPVYLRRARDVIDEVLARVSSEHRRSMLESIRMNRQVHADWQDHVAAIGVEDAQDQETRS